MLCYARAKQTGTRCKRRGKFILDSQMDNKIYIVCGKHFKTKNFQPFLCPCDKSTVRVLTSADSAATVIGVLDSDDEYFFVSTQ